jgi:hypothetical protein
VDLIVFSDLADESQKRFQDENPKADEEDIDQLPLYDLDTIVSATDSFSFQNKIGEGGFGVVYKVVFLYICRTVKKKKRSTALYVFPSYPCRLLTSFIY